MTSPSDFAPSRIVLLESLDPSERDAYFQLLLSSRVKIHQNEDGNYVANVRLQPPTAVSTVSSTMNESQGDTTVDNANQNTVHEGVRPSITTDRATADEQSGQPRLRSFSWLMKIIEELYDLRFKYDTSDEESQSLSFLNFVNQTLVTLKGTSKSADQMATDFHHTLEYYNNFTLQPSSSPSTHATALLFELSSSSSSSSSPSPPPSSPVHDPSSSRDDHSAMCINGQQEIPSVRAGIVLFQRFLSHDWGTEDLLFFLFVRSIVANTLIISSFKYQWNDPIRQWKPLYLTLDQCAHVTHQVYGQMHEDIYKTTMVQVCQ